MRETKDEAVGFECEVRRADRWISIKRNTCFTSSTEMDYLNTPNNRIIGQGDTCVIYVSESQRYILKIEPEAQLQTKFGQVKADDLLGHPYGVRYDCKKGWVMPLRLTPELWTKMLTHRTQILYQADISMILLQLDIKPGSIIVESGTGSGSLSHSLIRACRPNGYLHTFEVNESRAKEAQVEFKEHGLAESVNVTLRDVCEQGFGENIIEKADACILDLPRTWDAIDHAYRILKPFGSKLCTFSPCIEQVKQNVEKMTQLKMKDIVTLETLVRPYEIKSHSLRSWDEEDLNNLKDPFQPNMLSKKSYVFAKQLSESVSHSGYLTFASKRP